VIQAVTWLFLFGEMFRKVIDIPGFSYPGSYLAFLIPGIEAVTTTVQTLVIVGLGYAGGARYPGGALGIVVLIVAAVEVGVLWGALSNMTGMLARSREAVIGVYTVFMLPPMFLSSAFMQPGFRPAGCRRSRLATRSTGRFRSAGTCCRAAPTGPP
jgi:ABC-2 type transport system permease protein